MATFELTIAAGNKVSSKEYNTKEEAKAVFDRALRIAKANQKKYDGVQVLDYISIDSLYKGDVMIFDLYYVCGSTLKN